MKNQNINILKAAPLVTFMDEGIYVPLADVYIDPWKPVNKAIITHGHSDHARWGHKAYCCSNLSVPILKFRLGNINVTGYEYGENFSINGVNFSFHPAGHIIGSAQIRIAYKGEIWVVSGDFKREEDNVSTNFELVRCHHFITESTFGLPIFDWEPQSVVFNNINEWWTKNASQGRPSIITAYALGKAQRLLNHIDQSIGPVYCQDGIFKMNEVLISNGNKIKNGQGIFIHTDATSFKQALIICTSSAINTPWIKKFKNPSIAGLSGWMTIRNNRKKRGVEAGFVLSDHADWKELNLTIKETEAEQIYVTHGYTEIFTKWLLGKGYNARIVKTDFGETEEEIEI